jgi:hypothetical protein
VEIPLCHLFGLKNEFFQGAGNIGRDVPGKKDKNQKKQRHKNDIDELQIGSEPYNIFNARIGNGENIAPQLIAVTLQIALDFFRVIQAVVVIEVPHRILERGVAAFVKINLKGFLNAAQKVNALIILKALLYRGDADTRLFHCFVIQGQVCPVSCFYVGREVVIAGNKECVKPRDGLHKMELPGICGGASFHKKTVRGGKGKAQEQKNSQNDINHLSHGKLYMPADVSEKIPRPGEYLHGSYSRLMVCTRRFKYPPVM